MFSEEQLLAIKAQNKRMKINACAGSGKTTVCQEIIRTNPKLKILYLVYNKSMMLEAKERFGNLKNVVVKTTFSLAYASKGYQFANRLASNFNIYNMASILGIDCSKNENMIVCELLFDVFNEYLNSASMSIEDFVRSYKFTYFQNNLEATRLTKAHVCNFINIALKKMCDKNSTFQVPHALYFKLYQLSKPNLSNYDMVIVDEFQDSSECLIDIISSNVNVDRIVVVGDKRQSLYGFAGAVNGLGMLDWDEYSLTESYRIGTMNASLITSYINKAYDASFKIQGLNPKQYIAIAPTTKNHYNICRFNETIINGAMDNAIQNKKIFINGGTESLNLKYYIDIYNFFADGTKTQKLSRFTSFDHFAKYSKKIKDFNALRAIKLCKEYKDDFLVRIDALKRHMVNDITKADVSYTTAHKSKGMTIEIPVIVNKDFYDIIKYQDELISKGIDVEQELNALYVACTRGKGIVQLPNYIYSCGYDRGVENFGIDLPYDPDDEDYNPKTPLQKLEDDYYDSLMQEERAEIYSDYNDNDTSW